MPRPHPCPILLAFAALLVIASPSAHASPVALPAVGKHALPNANISRPPQRLPHAQGHADISNPADDANEDHPSAKEPKGKGRENSRNDHEDDDQENPSGSALEDPKPKPRDAKPEDAKPNDVKPDDAKPDDPKPDDTKPDDTKPDDAILDDAKPDDANLDDANPDDAKPDNANPDNAKPDDANTDDAKLDDANLDDAKPDDAKPADTKPEKKTNASDGQPPKSTSDSDASSAATGGTVPEDPAKSKEDGLRRVGGPVIMGTAPLIGLIAFAVAIVIGGLVFASQSSLCGLRRRADAQQYEPVSGQEGPQTEGSFGEFVIDSGDADGWNDGWEQDDWDAGEAAKA